MKTRPLIKKTAVTILVAIITTALKTVRAQSPTPGDEVVQMELIKGPQGVALSVVGHYDVGLDKGAGLLSSAQVPAPVVGEAVSKFILSDRKRSGLSADDNIRLVVKSVDPVDKHTSVAQIHQYVGELRVIDSDLSAVFTEDGFLQSLNGGVVPNRSPQAQPELKLGGVLEILKKDAKATAMGDLDAFQEAGKDEWRRKDGAAIVVGWSRKHNGAAWRASLPEETIWIDDKNGAILQRHSQRHYGPTTGCNVTHRQWPRATNGKATSLRESSTGTMVSKITCEANQSGATCSWRLQRQPFGFKHGIDRIQDENGGEKEDNQGCGSNNTPRFPDTNGDALREQGAFYVANQMRFYIDKNVWSQVAPNRDANLDIHMDDSSVVDDNGNPSAFFNGFWTEIRAHQNRGQQQVLMHEYGHYVVWTYDDVSQNCEQGSDEGDALNETLANVFAGLYALDSNEINPQYGAYSGLDGAPPPHTNAASLILHDANCSQGDPHNQGRAFEQAVWELLFNRDATIDNCTATTGHGNRIWVGASREDVLRHVGAALGSSLKILGQNITHPQVASQMIAKIRSDSGSNTANRAKSVFIHHGVL